MPADAMELEERIEALMPGDRLPAEDCSRKQLRQTVGRMTGSSSSTKLNFVLTGSSFDSGTNPIVLLRNLAALGTVSCCHLHAEELPALADLDPSQCYLGWTVELASVCPEAELREVFEFVEHLAEIRISCPDAPPQPGSAPAQNSTAVPVLAPPPRSRHSARGY